MRTKKKKKKGVCAFQNKFTQLCIFGYKVRDFTTAPLPTCPCPTHLPHFRKTNGELKCE